MPCLNKLFGQLCRNVPPESSLLFGDDINKRISWDGLIALQLFATCYSIVGILIVHCDQLRAYSNQQPLTRVEDVLHSGQICLFVF